VQAVVATPSFSTMTDAVEIANNRFSSASTRSSFDDTPFATDPVVTDSVTITGSLYGRAQHSVDSVAAISLEPEDKSRRGYITGKQLRQSRQRLTDLIMESDSEAMVEDDAVAEL
jgi:hypothetical protein